MSKTNSCQGCKGGAKFDMPISMAFQPIVSVSTGAPFAYEALLRGTDGAPASTIFEHVTPDNLYAFDQRCRTTAIALATWLNLPAREGPLLSINFLPNAVYEPRACIRLTLETAAQTGFPLDRIMFEFTEVEKLDTAHVLNILRVYKALGFHTAIDDFGAGHAGLDLLARFQPDVVKLDMALIRDIDKCSTRRTIVGHTIRMLEDLDVTPVCEGIETLDEYTALRDLGVDLMQGYLFARPAFEALPDPVLPALDGPGQEAKIA